MPSDLRRKRKKQLTLFDTLPPPKAARSASDGSDEEQADDLCGTRSDDKQPVDADSAADSKDASARRNSTTPESPAGPSFNTLDITDVVGKTVSTMESETIRNFVRNRVPRREIALPSKEYKDSKRASRVYTRHCKHDWFEHFQFTTFSERERGIFCLPCVLFSSETAHGGARKVSILISKPLTNWKDAVADLNNHEKLQYHVDAATKLASFCTSIEKPSSRIDCVLSSVQQQRIAHNRKVIASITECIELCGRQGIALRGHRDDATTEEHAEDQGKLKAVIQFRIKSGDKILQEHLASCGDNATYISKTSQNDLLLCMGDVIREAIVKDVKNSHYYAILADEVTDVSGWEQLGVALRYVKDGHAHEKLIELVACESITGAEICKSLLTPWYVSSWIQSCAEPRAMMEQAICLASLMGARPCSGKKLHKQDTSTVVVTS